jgi:dolichol-phosphate mannosyltransferase
VVAAIAVGVAAFAALRALGLAIEPAQALSFVLAVGIGIASAGVAGRIGLGVLAWVLPVGFALHAGLLTLGIESFGLPPTVAVVPASASTVFVIAAGLVLLGARGPGHAARLDPWAGRAVFALLAVLLLRLVYAPLLQLTPQEAYYWRFSEHLALGYLDHPPLTAWLIAASTVVADREFWVRLPAVAAALATVAYVAAWARELGGPALAWRTALLAAVLPYFALSGFVMTPDAPLMAAWAAALFALHRALTRGTFWAWITAGAAVGVGLLSKYTIVLLLPAIAVWLTLERRWLATLRTPGPWWALVIAMLVFAPVVVWNAQHDWASFTYQGSRRLAPDETRFDLPEFALAIAALLTPWGLLALWQAWRARGVAAAGAPPGLGAGARRFCWVFTLVPLAPLAVASLWTETRFHWTGPIWLAALPLLATTLGPLPPGSPAAPTRLARIVAKGWAPTIAVLLALYALPVLHYGVHGLGDSFAHHRYVETNWRDLRLQVQDLENAVSRETGQRPAVVGLDRHDTASLMAFYDPHGDGALDTAARNILFDEPAHMYEFWFAPEQLAGRHLVLVACRRDLVEDPRLAPQAVRLGPVQQLHVRQRGVHTRDCFARVLYGFAPTMR